MHWATLDYFIQWLLENTWNWCHSNHQLVGLELSKASTPLTLCLTQSADHHVTGQGLQLSVLPPAEIPNHQKQGTLSNLCFSVKYNFHSPQVLVVKGGGTTRTNGVVQSESSTNSMISSFPQLFHCILCRKEHVLKNQCVSFSFGLANLGFHNLNASKFTTKYLGSYIR